MKHTLPILAVLCLTSSVIWAGDPAVPDGVRYKRTSDEINDKATAQIRALFVADATDKQVLSSFQNEVLICGPALWKALKDDEALSKLEGGEVKIEVPVKGPDGKDVRTDVLHGHLFQNGKEVLAFWRAFVKYADFADLKIRKLTPSELRTFWAMISFDITEPVFVVEGTKRKVLVVFTAPEKLSICWIDDLAGYRSEKPAEGKK